MGAASDYGSGDTSGPGLSDIQVAGLELWESWARLDALDELGFQGLVERHLRRAVELFPRADRDIALAVLGALVTPSGSRAVITREQLVEVGRKEVRRFRDRDRQVVRILRRLEREARPTRREVRANVTYYEIASEFLVPWSRRQGRPRERQNDRARPLRRAALAGLLLIAIAADVVFVVVRTRTVQAIADDRVRAASMRAADARRERRWAASNQRTAETKAAEAEDEVRRLCRETEGLETIVRAESERARATKVAGDALHAELLELRRQAAVSAEGLRLAEERCRAEAARAERQTTQCREESRAYEASGTRLQEELDRAYATAAELRGGVTRIRSETEQCRAALGRETATRDRCTIEVRTYLGMLEDCKVSRGACERRCPRP